MVLKASYENCEESRKRKFLCNSSCGRNNGVSGRNNHLNVYSSLRVEVEQRRMMRGCGWHLLCFTYVCDFWVFAFHSSMESDERKRTSGWMKEMKKEKYNENLNVFISFLGLAHSFVSLVRTFSICQIAC